MKIRRGNAWAEIEGAPSWFYDYAGRHLSVPVEAGTKRGSRFGRVWYYNGEAFGSLLQDRRVAAGLVDHVAQIAAHYRLSAEVVDERVRPPAGTPWWSVDAAWRPYQNVVHQALLAHETGVVDCPPRGGKTLMSARIIDALGLPTLVIAPSVAIVRQTYATFCRIFGPDSVALLAGSALPHERDAERPIVVSTVASAVRQSREWFDTRGLLVIDEFHHAAADSYHRLNDLASNIYFRYCFTGTHFRTGPDMLAMEAICSHRIAKITVDELIADGYLVRPRVHFFPVRAGKVSADGWQEVYEQGVAEHAERNQLVVDLANRLSSSRVPTIVLVRRREQADRLGERIHNSIVVKGGESSLTDSRLKDFAEGRVDVIVGTTVLGEGVDLPRAGALIYASGGCDGVSMMQSYFRPLTAAPGKEHAQIFDFDDRHHRTLRRQAADRIAFARAQLGDGNVSTET